MANKSQVTRLLIPEDQDPLDHIFGRTVYRVPESRLTPDLISQYYQRCVDLVDFALIPAKNKHVVDGLVSIPAMLRHTTDRYHVLSDWMERVVDDDVLGTALKEAGLARQSLLLNVFGFRIPKWKDAPMKDITPHYAIGREKELGCPKQRIAADMETSALLIDRKKRPVVMKAVWQPKEGWFPHADPSRVKQYVLSVLSIQTFDWKDEALTSLIHENEWTDYAAFASSLYCVAETASEIYRGKMHLMRDAAAKLEKAKRMVKLNA